MCKGNRRKNIGQEEILKTLRTDILLKGQLKNPIWVGSVLYWEPIFVRTDSAEESQTYLCQCHHHTEKADPAVVTPAGTPTLGI